MKRLLCLVLVLVLAASIISGCTGNQVKEEYKKATESQASKNAEAGKTEGGKKATVIKWAFWFPEPTEFIKLFNESQNEVKLEYDNIGSGNTYVQALNTRLAAGEAPDLYNIYYRETYEQQAKEKGVVDLTDKPFWQYFDSVAIEQNKAHDGRIYALPISASINGMFYNKDILDKYNISPPANWQEYLNACAKLKENGVVPQVQGMKEGWQCKFVAFNPMSALFYKDELWVQKLNNGEVKWTDPDMLAQFKKKEEFMKKGYVHENTLSMTFQQAWQVFCEGKAAFIQGGSYYLNNVFPQLRPEFNWGLVPIPAFEKGQTPKVEYFTDSNPIVINAKGKNVEQATKFIDWFAQPDNMKSWSEMALAFIPHKDPNYDIDPAAEKFKPLFDYPKYKFDREPAYVAAEFGKLQQEMMLGQKTAEEVVKELQDKTDISIKK